jgi:hypothetical protein
MSTGSSVSVGTALVRWLVYVVTVIVAGGFIAYRLAQDVMK